MEKLIQNSRMKKDITNTRKHLWKRGLLKQDYYMFGYVGVAAHMVIFRILGPQSSSIEHVSTGNTWVNKWLTYILRTISQGEKKKIFIY